MIKSNLKPCPFCGSKARAYTGPMDGYGIVCDKCGVKLYGKNSYAAAARAWNKRNEAALKDADLCEKCYFGTAGVCKSSFKCAECKMYSNKSLLRADAEDAQDVTNCKCATVKSGDVCPYYRPLV